MSIYYVFFFLHGHHMSNPTCYNASKQKRVINCQVMTYTVSLRDIYSTARGWYAIQAVTKFDINLQTYQL